MRDAVKPERRLDNAVFAPNLLWQVEGQVIGKKVVLKDTVCRAILLGDGPVCRACFPNDVLSPG